MFKKAKNVLKDSRGFTLVELIVVVAIIAVLAGVLMPRLLGYTNQARVSRTMGDIAAMRSIIEAYAANEGQGYYPKADNTSDDGVAKILQAKGIKWTGGTDGVKDPWGTPYEYMTFKDENSVERQGYLIRSAGPDRKSGTADDVWATNTSAPVQSGTPDQDPGKAEATSQSAQ